MPSSRTLPSLERKPGGPDNWVERVGGLPKYIELVAKHLHYKEGFTISHAIATAVNTVKRWSHKGTVVKYNDPKNNHVYTITAAKAAKDVAEWEAKKAAARGLRGGAGGGRSGRLSPKSIKLSEASVDLAVLVERANAIADPEARGAARLKVLDLALTKDGRKSFKRQGKWGHGFVPLDAAAKRAKAKGSPIAEKRMERLYGSPSKAKQASRAATKATLAARAKKGATHGTQIRSNTGKKGGMQQERVQDVGQSVHADIRDANKNQRAKPEGREKSKGGRISPRATQPWDQIPESEKTVRNGKKYVMTTFQGRKLLTEWHGNEQQMEAPGVGDRQYTSVRTEDLQKMTTSQLRRLLKSGKNTSPAVRKQINKMLQKKLKQQRSQA